MSRACRFPWLVMLLLVALAPGRAEAGWRRFAVVAGSNRGLVREQALRYAEADARRVADVLAGPGGVAPGDLTLLAGNSREAFRGAVRDVDADLRAAAGAGDRTLLFLYFSGHSDGASLQFGADPLPFGEVRAMLDASPATLKVLIVDTCQSGGLTGLKGIVPLAEVDLWLRGAGSAAGTVIVAASSTGEVAQESEELGGSFFTHHLLWGLRGAADVDQDQRVTLAEAYAYAYGATVDGTWHTLAGRQHPMIELDLDQRGEVTLTDLTVRDASIVFDAATSGAFALLDPHGGGILAELKKPAGQVQRLAVAAGPYWVANRRGERIFVQMVSLAPGGEVRVDPAAMLDHTAVLATAEKSGRGHGRGPVQVLAGYGLSSGTLGKTSAMHHALAGVRWDVGPLALMPRLVYGETHGLGDLGTDNTRRFTVRGVGLETALLWRFEVSLLDLFAGLNVGAHWLWQRFDGVAPLPDASYSGLAGLVGLIAGLDVPFAGGWSAQLFWELDEWIYVEAGQSDPTTSFHVKGNLGIAYRF